MPHYVKKLGGKITGTSHGVYVLLVITVTVIFLQRGEVVAKVRD